MKYVDVRTLCKLSRAKLFAAFALIAALIAPMKVRAATITVNTLADPILAANCTLHDAITAANTQAAVNGCLAGTGKNDTIQFSVTGTIALSGTLPAIVNGETLTIQGPGAPGIAIDGGSAHQVMVVNGVAVVTLQNLTIAHGAAIFSGGGILNGGTLTVTNCTFSSNSASGSGGGGILNGGTLTVTNCTFSSNSASGSGGGIRNVSVLTVNNSTFSGNSAGVLGGGGIFSNHAILKLKGTILAGSTLGGNCGGGNFTDAGYNISSDNSCGFSGTSRNNRSAARSRWTREQWWSDRDNRAAVGQPGDRQYPGARLH